MLSEIWSPAYGGHEGGEPVHPVHQVVVPQSGLRPQERRVEESHASGPALHSDNSGQILVLYSLLEEKLVLPWSKRGKGKKCPRNSFKIGKI